MINTIHSISMRALTHSIARLLASSLACCATLSASAQSAPLPSIPNLAGKVLTVLGPMDPSVIGPSLTHEHIFIDFKRGLPVNANPTEAALFAQPLTLDNLSAVRYRGQRLRTNPFLADVDEMTKEVLEFKRFGGKTIIDVSNIGLGRDPLGLTQIANQLDMSIIMGSGWYDKASHPATMDQMTVEEMTDIIVRDIVVGVDGTGIRSGIIGEVGVAGNPLTPNELKSTRASARASRLTGAPITFHVGGSGEEKFTVLDVVASEGVDLSRVIMGHSSSFADNMPFIKRLLDRGVYIGFDYLGVLGGPGGVMGTRNDQKVLQGVVDLVKAGYANRIVLGHDVCTKIQLKKYGGTGFSYISEYFLPELRKRGVSEADIHKMMVENPRKVLTFVAPQAMVKPKK